jgi:hypothetical protein
MSKRKCRVCGCTDEDCRGCIEKTGEPCYWVEKDLCSACAGAPPMSQITGDHGSMKPAAGRDRSFVTGNTN